MTPTIHEISTIHKGRSNWIEMSLIYKQYLECWLLVVFVLTFFSLATCLVILAYRVCQRQMRKQNAYFNLRRVFSMNDVTSVQRWFPHARARAFLTRQKSQYGPEVISPAVIAKTLTSVRGMINPSSSACTTFWHHPKYNFMSWFSCVLLSDINNSHTHYWE